MSTSPPAYTTTDMLAFEPISCAMLACAIEHFICCNRPRGAIPRARVWMRRNSETILDAIAQEITEPILDATNRIDTESTLGAIALLLIARTILILVALYRQR